MSNIDIVFEINRSRITHLLLIAIMLLIFTPVVQAQAPTATTSAASGIGLILATVNGTVNANDSQTTVTFEYGLDTNYDGSFEADQSPVSGAENTAVSATISELEPNTTYHYRVAAVNASGTTYGADITFTTLELPPTAETTPATGIGVDGATLNGLVFGRDYDTDVIFEYGADTSYGTIVTAEQSPLLDPFNTINMPVSKILSGLTTNTTYHYRVVASNVNGTSYGEDMIFTIGTVGSAPNATTDAASEISSSAATLNGTVNANDSQTTVTFEYGMDTNYGEIFVADQSPVSGSSDTPINTTIEELDPNTVYHYRVVAQNANGTTNGADMSFTTLVAAPTAITNPASAVGPETATLNGTANANGASTTVTFEYGPDTNYGTTITADQSPVTGITDTPVSNTITGLVSSTTYHYRVVATNLSGTTYGTDMTFTAGAVPPTATTNAATNVSTTTATFNGTINANNHSTAVTFEYGRNTNYGRTVAATPGMVAGSSATAVSAAVSDLLPNTTYHFRVVGINNAGTVYGVDMSFITGNGPLVTTNSATAVGTSGATLNGVVNPNNENTTVTFEYGLTMAYGTTVTADQSPLGGTSNIAVTRTISALTPSTTYHYRAVGQNASGTTFGANQIITTTSTDPSAPTAVTNPATSVGATGAMLSGTADSKNQSTTVTFEYGLTAAYGETVPADQSPFTSEFPATLSTALNGLTSNTTYHYRVVAENAFGIAYGDDITFFTSPPGTPTATTEAVSSVSTSGATLNGTVNARNSLIFAINFEYGTSAAYGNIVEAIPNTASGFLETAVSQNISGLANNTMYHYRVVVQRQFGVVNGDNMSFTTDQSALTAKTDPASGVGITSATLNGTVNANNTTATVTFEYGLDTNYGRVESADQSPVTGNADTAVSASLTDLQPFTTYHYRVAAQNTNNTVFGADMTFTTEGTPPTATTLSATAISSSGATLNGTVNANNDNATVTFEYGLTTAYGEIATADQSPVVGNSFTSVSAAITSLTGNTTYHYRLVAQNGSGTTNGSDKTFFTGAAAPTAITGNVTEIGSTIATLNGTVIANNAATTVTFEYGLDASYGRSAEADPNLVSGSTNTDVNSILTGLVHSTTYYYRIVAVNSAGTTNGADETFMTSDPTSTEQVIISLPTEYSLSQNYPNPFNPSTTIEFSLPTPEFVKLKLYHILGKAVVELISHNLPAGVHQYQFDGSSLASGIYYYQVIAGEYREVKKMILLR